jgi:leucyl-tRNA synthetase
MAKDKTYVLGMFPYPSGEGLHVGHGRIFSAVDVMGRYFRMKGKQESQSSDHSPKIAQGSELGGQVLSPMGWDAFGLPAENAAIKAKKNPIDMVPHNYGNFRAQMKNLSFDFDWKHEFATTDPTYYGFTQWLFLHLYEAGLVYREEVAINWCPKCLTGLANEEVMGDGTHERCGTVVTKKSMPQWVMKITNYADRLLNDLSAPVIQSSSNPVDDRKTGKQENRNTNMGLDWPRGILEMQRNWIGKKEGVRVKFQVESPSSLSSLTALEVFTTRIDTINGVTFIVVAPEIADGWINGGFEANEEVKKYIEKSLQKSDQTRQEGEKNKTGVDTGLKAINPWNQEEVPIYVADYVLPDFGTGCVMGVPQYDERDLAFATKYNLEVKDLPLDKYEDVLAKLTKDKVANSETNWHLRDWVFSRQRYWGEPIPLVYCEKCGDQNGVVPLTEKDLPLELPYLESYEPTDTGESPLSRINEWVNTKCPKCGGPARRETDTMPNWAGSCWYFLAFPWWSEKTKTQLDEFKKKSETPYTNFWKEVAKPEIDKWLPVDWYLGGAEHAVLHLLYARFWVKVFQDRGLLDFSEPFLRLRSVGMVLAEDGKKMSKSLGNVINPDEMVAKFGSDAVRLYEMFMGPWDQAISWDTRSLIGQKRFIERIGEAVKKVGDKTSPILSVNLVKLGEKVEKGIVEQKFNTAIASIMEFVNMWRGSDLVMSQNDVNKFAQLLSPFAPICAKSIWDQAETAKWPTFEEVSEMAEVPVTIAVQVNGKLRATVELESSKSKVESEVMKIVMDNEQVKKWAPGEIKKTIFIPGKIVNLVV